MRIEGINSAARTPKPLEAVGASEAAVRAPKDQVSQGQDNRRQAEHNSANMSQGERNLLPVSEKAMLEAIEKANKAVVGNTRFEFSIHEGTKQIMVKVIDEQSNEIIRQVPSEKILDIIAGIWESVGLFVDERR